jgi:hypothetical protein
MIDHVLNFLKREGHAPTVDAYCELNYSMSWADLQRSENDEWIAEVLSLVEDGELKVVTPGERAKTMIILHDEESFARFARRLVPDLPDNIVEEKIAKERFRKTGKMIVGDVQSTRMACRAAAKMSPEQKRKIREKIRWEIYDKKLRIDVVN